MDFDFHCWACGALNAIWGQPRGFWSTTHYDLPTEWACWLCTALNTTPDD